MNKEFGSWAVIAPNNDTGLGRMAQDIKSILPLSRHLITGSYGLDNRPLVEPYDILLDQNCSIEELEKSLTGLNGIIFFERANWHPYLLSTTRRLGIRSVCVPMWEWFNGSSPNWRNCDFFACPNLVCLRTVRSYGFFNSTYIPWTLDISRLPYRSIQGSAKHFVHNAGIIDSDDRKGTFDAVLAFSKVIDPSLSLTLRLQKNTAIDIDDSRVSLEVGNLENPALLYSSGDAFIQPSKLEGIGFMVLEAVASGLPVITLDIEPVNEWGSQPELLAKVSPFRWHAKSSAWVPQSHLRKSSISKIANKIRWAARNDLSLISERNRNWAIQTFNPERLRLKWSELLTNVMASEVNYHIEECIEPPNPCHKLSYRIRQALYSRTGINLPLLQLGKGIF